MANWDKIVLWGEPREFFAEAIQGWEPRGRIDCFERGYSDELGHYVSYQGSPLVENDLIDLSNKHPGLSVFVKVCFDHDNFHDFKVVVYRNGDYKFLRSEPNYHWLSNNSFAVPEKVIANLEDKLNKVFKHIDYQENDNNYDCVYYPSQVTVEAEEGKYKMKATKCGVWVDDVQVFEKTQSFTWDPVKSSKGRGI